MKVTLKTQAEIEEMCYETEAPITLGLDGIGYDPTVLNMYDFNTVVQLFKYDDDTLPAVEIGDSEGNTIYVHITWLDKIDGCKVKLRQNVSDVAKYLPVTSKLFIDLESNEFKSKEDLLLCSHCKERIVRSKGLCSTCIEDLTYIHMYSYKPTPKFIGKQIKADEEHPVWFGIELESAFDKVEVAVLKSKHNDELYVKADGSISGSGFKAELVTHPMSFTHLMGKSSWINSINGNKFKDSDDNGVHIHISRTSFTDNKHYGLFYFLLHDMHKVSTYVGGRPLTNYCALSPVGRIFTKENKDTIVGNRSVYINERNDNTVELRFFKGTTDATKLKAYVQYAESLIKYSRYKSKRVTANGWFQYISKKPNKYAELLKVLEGFPTDTLSDIVVVFKKPRRVTIKAEKLRISDLPFIVKVRRDGYPTINGIIGASIRNNRIEVETDRRSYSFFLSEIKEVVVERE